MRNKQALKVSFNCSKAVAEIKKLHTQFVGFDRQSLELATQIGKKLLNIKKSLKATKSAKWMLWCKKHLGFAHGTVTNYMRVFRANQAGKLKNVTTLTAAYEVLAAQSTRTRKPAPAPEISLVDKTQTMEWLNNQPQPVTTLKIRTQSIGQFQRGLMQGVAANKAAVERGGCLVLVFEIVPATIVPETTVKTENTTPAAGAASPASMAPAA